MRFACYNIRHAQGGDGRVSTARVVETLRSLDADLIGVNEVWRLPGWFEQPKALGTGCDMDWRFLPLQRWGPLVQGNVILSRTPITKTTEIAFPRAIERRGCLLAETIVDGTRVHFGTLHLSLRRSLRARQLHALAKVLPSDAPLVLAGDFNGGPEELEPLAGLLTVVADPPATYPPSRPRLRLDHVVFSADWELVSLETVPSRASDHLPLVAELRLRDAGEGTEP